jgi:acid phosphatase (class A)
LEPSAPAACWLIGAGSDHDSPEKRDAILARADDYAYSRLICGVHYLTDVVASKSVAYAMIGIIANDPVFRKEFGTAKAETRYALDF